MTEQQWKQLRVLHNSRSWKDNSIQEYYNLLKIQIFPAIEDLTTEGLINNYHFLNHSDKDGLGLDFRILPSEEKKVPQIKEILNKHKLTENLENYNGDHEDTLAILKLTTEIIKIIIKKEQLDKIEELHRQQQHYQNNALGMNSKDEHEFLNFG